MERFDLETKYSIGMLEDMVEGSKDLYKLYSKMFEFRAKVIKHTKKLAKQKHLYPEDKNKSRGKSTSHRGSQDRSCSYYTSLIRNLTETMEYIKFKQRSLKGGIKY